MTKCKHEHACAECIIAEIKELEDKITELTAKLPKTVVIKEYVRVPQIVPVPYYPSTPMPLAPYSYPIVTCQGGLGGNCGAGITNLLNGGNSAIGGQ